MSKFQKGVSGNPGGRPRADPVTVDLVAEIRRQLALVDPGSRQSKAAELVTALIAAGCGGDVKACMHLIDRIHGRVESRMEMVAFEERVESAAAAAADWARAVVMLSQVFPAIDADTAGDLLDTLRAGDGESIWDLARRFGLSVDQLEPAARNYTSLTEALRDRLGLLQPIPEPDLPPPPKELDSDAAFLEARAVEQERARRERIKTGRTIPPAPPAAPEVKPEPPPGPQVLEGDVYDFPGFGIIQIKR